MSPPPESGRELAARLRRRWSLVDLAATLAGAFVLLVFIHALHDAQYPGHTRHSTLVGTAQVIAFLLVALPVAWLWRARRTRALWRWLEEDRPPRPAERDLVLRAPLRELVVPATLWGVAALVFAGIQVGGSPDYAWNIALTVALGGLTTCALIYLMVERLLRPATARALASRPPETPVGPGVCTRIVTAWGLASGVPMLGIVSVALGGLSGEVANQRALAVAALILGLAGLVFGAVAILLSCRALADPLDGVRAGLARIRGGSLDARVTVNDGSEVGLLQAGFNDMAAGLGERERLRDLFGRHVGEGVARRALEEGAQLGGEVREVAALFVDLVGSTALASRRPPQEVVSVLNRFFAVIVEVVGSHGGWVNRFEGDGALCVFGAPAAHPDDAGRALAAARELSRRMRRELPELDLGIGVSAGPAVAGNIGTECRFDYTVIGDSVNEAARLCELAKRRRERVLASAAVVNRAPAREAKRWRVEGQTTLRGRAAPTRLATPMVRETTDGESVPRAGAAVPATVGGSVSNGDRRST